MVYTLLEYITVYHNSGMLFHCLRAGFNVRHSISTSLPPSLPLQLVEGVVETEGGEEVAIKLLDSDSITQAKEKILDTLYKNTPVSRRPALTSVDLELRTTGGITLRDQDQTNEYDGEWIKINTLGHYKLHEMVRGRERGRRKSREGRRDVID